MITTDCAICKKTMNLLDARKHSVKLWNNLDTPVCAECYEKVKACGEAGYPEVYPKFWVRKYD